VVIVVPIFVKDQAWIWFLWCF